MNGALITAIQRFSVHDGDGVRTVVFMKGCPLRCAWCHNPETQRSANELLYVNQLCIGCGKCLEVCKTGAHIFSRDGVHTVDRTRCVKCMSCAEVCPPRALLPAARLMTVREVADEVLRDTAFYGKNGGVTLSGGEPAMNPDFSEELLSVLKQSGITTAVETCGAASHGAYRRLIKNTDCFLWDIKDTDAVRYHKNTGGELKTVLTNLRLVDGAGIRTVLRCILVKGVNTDTAHYDAVATLFRSLKNCAGVTLLPYHPYGGSKREQTDGYNDGRPEWTPSADDITNARTRLTESGAVII